MPNAQQVARWKALDVARTLLGTGLQQHTHANSFFHFQLGIDDLTWLVVWRAIWKNATPKASQLVSIF